MDALEIVSIVAETLNRLGTDYMLVGSFSSNLYGIPRMTRDAAFIIEFFELSSDPHDRQRFVRRRKAAFAGGHVFVPSPEDVIITKLRWSKAGKRQKDIEDVQSVLAVQGDVLDLAYIRQWTARHGTRELFEQMLASAR